MSPRKKLGLALVLGTLATTACDVGQGVKKLGSITAGGTDTSGTNSDSFAVTLAYRDPSSDLTAPSRVISIQGVRGLPSASLVTQCTSTGTNCACDFYKNSSDTAPYTSVSVGISAQNNSFSCNIPPSVLDATLKTTPNLFTYVVLKRLDDTTKHTGLVEIKHTLAIEDVLGPSLLKTQVRGIFAYTCTRTFFEGEGVSSANISCVNGQHLGVITADYNFYTYKSQLDHNDAGVDIPFPSDVCKRLDFLKIQCGISGAPQLHYGFYRTSADPFVVGISMTRAPQAGTGDTEPLSDTYGFAALPDSLGNCPTGLMKIRPWVAQPASIVPTGNVCPTNGCPSSFINTGNLNNTVVETTTAPPANFLVQRKPNTTACSNTGDCTPATFGGVVQAESVAYSPQTPVVCAIPPGLLTGLF